MHKNIRNAVRTFLIEDNSVICTKYKVDNFGYIDIPGGKIELDETPQQAAVREFKEETGIDISELEKLGKIIVEYPDRIYNMEVFIATKYNGFPQEFNENESFWVSINDLLKNEKRYAITYLLQPEFQNVLKLRVLISNF